MGPATTEHNPIIRNNDISDQPAYAKLQGSNFVYYVRRYPLDLGRQSKTTTPDVHLGNFRNISRVHAQLTWNEGQSCWTLYPAGHNGIVVNNIVYACGSEPIPLRNGDCIQIGDACFYFFLPHDPPSTAGQTADGEGDITMKIEAGETNPSTTNTSNNTSANTNTTTNASTAAATTTPVKPERVGDNSAKEPSGEEDRPGMPYACLIAQALLTEENNRMTYPVILKSIVDKHRYYKTAGKEWEYGIMSALNEDSRFVRLKRTSKLKNSHHLWTFDVPKTAKQFTSHLHRLTRFKSSAGGGGGTGANVQSNTNTTNTSTAGTGQGKTGEEGHPADATGRGAEEEEIVPDSQPMDVV